MTIFVIMAVRLRRQHRLLRGGLAGTQFIYKSLKAFLNAASLESRELKRKPSFQ
jgi:hypothetical protein